MPDSSVNAVNGPTDLGPDELAEHKRVAAVDYHKRELALLRDTLKAMLDRGADKDKVVNQRKMIDSEQAALDAAKGK